MTREREASRGQLCNEGGMISGHTLEGWHTTCGGQSVKTRWSLAHPLLTSPFPCNSSFITYRL